jgi:hypothetical protein
MPETGAFYPVLLYRRVHTLPLKVFGSGAALFICGVDLHKIHTLQNDDTPPFRTGRVIFLFSLFSPANF